MSKKTTYIAMVPVKIEIDESVRGVNVTDAIRELANNTYSCWSGAGWSYSKKKCRIKDISVTTTVKNYNR